MAGKVDTSWRILATLLSQPRGSEFPEYLTSLAIPGLALLSFAQNGRVRDARETLDRERRARHRWERASAHPSSAVEHDTVSALRDSGPDWAQFQREGLDLALAESTSVRLTLTSETAARACAVGRPSPVETDDHGRLAAQILKARTRSSSVNP
jgi:hypothetical protein